MRLAFLLPLLLWLPATVAAQQDASAPPPAAPPTLETVLVTGEQPGPGLWRVSRGDKELWILGTQSPLPRRMRWRADEVESRIAQSQAVIAMPRVKLDADVGPIGTLLLLPSLMGARKNPDEAPLSEVVPAPLYARWRTLKDAYLPRHRGVERWRPLFAAQKLYEEAIGDVGLSQRDIVWPRIRRAARRHDVPILEPELELRIEDARATLKAFRRSALDDVACFELTMRRLETDLGAMRARASAWAVGDIEALRALPFEDHLRPCFGAVLGADALAGQGVQDLPARIRALWLQQAEQALATHASTVAVLPMRALLGPDNVLAALRARGFQVEAP